MTFPNGDTYIQRTTPVWATRHCDLKDSSQVRSLTLLHPSAIGLATSELPLQSRSYT